MGNILTQKRHKQDGTQIEDMTYRYQRDANGFLLSNRLYHVNDAIDSTIDATDIDDQGAGFDPLNVNINGAYNYVYDEEGRLVKDKAEDIQQIVWRVDGKVKEINRSTGSTMPRLKFDYDAMGRRIAKHVYNNQTGLLEKSTYYLLDAQGNTMATYDYAQEPNQTMSFQLKERHIYGSSRLGMYAESVVLVENPSTETTNTVVNQGFKQYEMTNHLGNVLTVIHDIKIPLNNGSGPAVSSYRVGIRTCSDYSPFGVELDGRTVSGGYRYGYQGSEKDNEFKGNGNSYTTEFRQLDPRLGRWLILDPLMAKFPNQSPYAGFSDNPILLIDPFGLEGENPNIEKQVEGIEVKDNITWNPEGINRPTVPASINYKEIKVTDYSYEEIYNNYNSDGKEIIEENPVLNYLVGQNSCAIRLSHALNGAGYKIPRSQDTPTNVRIQNTKDGNYILDAVSMANYLSLIQKPTYKFSNLTTAESVDKAIDKVHAQYDDLKGIIVLVAGNAELYEASGHVDLLYEDFMWDLSMYSSGLIGGNDVGPYIKSQLEVDFTMFIWILDHD